jgi:DNA polymerase III epsilon subunit-like protein
MNTCSLLDYLLFSDTETTGLIDPVRLVQLGCRSSVTGEMLNELVLPPKPIELGAMAVCPIRWADVMYKQPFASHPVRKRLMELLKDHTFVAHNAAYDVEVLANEGIDIESSLCTRRIAKHVLKSERYSLQYFRAKYDMPVEGPAHTALADALVVEKLLVILRAKVKELYGITDYREADEKMMELSNTPLSITTLRYWAGNRRRIADIARVDMGYLESTQEEAKRVHGRDRDYDLIFNLQEFLDKKDAIAAETADLVRAMAEKQTLLERYTRGERKGTLIATTHVRDLKFAYLKEAAKPDGERDEDFVYTMLYYITKRAA